MRIVLTREVDGAWDDLVAADPDATIHHERVWLDCLHRAYPAWRPLYILAVDDAGRLHGGLPAIEARSAGLRQLFSLPYGTYGQPLASPGPDAAGIREALFAAWRMRAVRPGTVRAHLEWFARSAPYLPTPGDRYWTGKRVHLLDLSPGYEAVRSAFRKTLSGTCRQAERRGVSVIRDSGPRARTAFVDMYLRQAADWPGHTPMRPEFLHQVLDRLSDRASLWVAKREETPLGAALLLRFGDMVVTWFTVQSPESRSLRGSGSLLYRAMIEDSCSRSVGVFNFGSSQGAESIEFFKESFGAMPFPYVAWHRDARWFRTLRRLRSRLRT